MLSTTETLDTGSVHDYSDIERDPHTPPAKRRRCSPPTSPEGPSEETQEEIDELLVNVPSLKENFNIIDKIGEGTFSSVYSAKLKNFPSLNKLYALKHIIPTSHPSRIESELRCLQEMGGHDNIMGVKACLRKRDHVVIVMPYFPHDRFQDYVQNLSASEIRLYMQHLFIALRRVHEQDIIHRDVKPSNFLYNRQQGKYALVDFGLAHKAPVPLKSKSAELSMSTRSVSSHTSTTDPSRESNSIKQCLSPNKRKARKQSIENQGMSMSPCKKRIITDSHGNRGPKLSEVSVNIQEIRPQTKSEIRKPKAISKSNSPPAEKLFKADYTKGMRSPRRQLLTKQALNARNKLFNSSRIAVKPNLCDIQRKKPGVVGGRSGVYSNVAPASCQCFGQPKICSMCMARSGQIAPRAGTPGFRSPEVLMKYPNQTTAVDMWSAGVIFLSLLSGRYPFFKANDDLTALAQIISVMGSAQVKEAAKTYGKFLICSPTAPALDLKIMCEQLRGQNRSARAKGRRTRNAENSPGKEDPIPDSAFDLLRCLLDLNPKTRICAEDALNHPFILCH